MSQRDALVECLSAEYRLPDLGLHLFKGDTVWVDAPKAAASAQLKQAQAMRALKVTWRARALTTHHVPAVTRGGVRPKSVPTPAPKPPQPPPEPPAQARLGDEIQMALRDASFLAILRAMVQDEVAKAVPAQAPPVRGRKKSVS